MIVISKQVDLDDLLKPEPLHGYTFTTEHAAHKFVIACYQNGEHIALTGTVTAKFLKSDGVTVDLGSGDYASLTGIDEDGNAFVILHQICYTTPGWFQLSVFNTHTTEYTGCIYSCTGTVQRTSGSTEVVPGTTVPDLSALTATIAACEEATEEALAAVPTVSGTTLVFANVETT